MQKGKCFMKVQNFFFLYANWIVYTIGIESFLESYFLGLQDLSTLETEPTITVYLIYLAFTTHYIII